MQIQDSAKIVVVGNEGHRMEYSAEQIAEVISKIAAAFQVSVEFVLNNLSAFAERFEEMLPDIIKSFEIEEECEYYRKLHKLDFTRKKISHQVMCRKPKHLVKKVIR